MKVVFALVKSTTGGSFSDALVVSKQFLEGMLGHDGIFHISRLMNMNVAEVGKVIDKDRGMFVAPMCQFVSCACRRYMIC